MRFRLVILLLLPLAVRAQTPGACAPGGATALLDVNDVEARLFNQGNLFFGESAADGFFQAAYHVPKNAACGDDGALPCSALYAASFWLGGHIDGELRMASARFTRYEFWPGPLLDGAALPNPADCSAYDRIFVVSREDVARYLQTGEVTDDLRDWPVHLGAPVLDGDGVEGNYDLEAGDQPAVYGDQTAWWVMNDVGNVHEETGSNPLGVEVQVTAFAAPSTYGPIHQTTFYRFRVVNRNTRPIEDAHLAFYWDTDLGDAQNDWMGTDTTRAMVYAFNAYDDGVYVDVPPAFGVRVLESPAGADGAPLGLTASMTLINGATIPATGDPHTAEGYYHVMQGRWTDGAPVTASGIGYMTDGPETVYMLPGDPVEATCWSATNTCDGSMLNPANRRAIAGAGPFRLAPGEATEAVFALVFAVGQDRLDSVEALRRAADVVEVAWEEGLLEPVRVEVEPGPPEVPGAIELELPRPNPFTDRLTVRYTLPAAMTARITLLDVLGREVALLASGEQAAGLHEAEVDASGLPAGLYLVRFEAGAEARTFTVVKAR